MSTPQPWRPEIVNPGSHFLHEQYGITEARRLELCEQLGEMTHKETPTVTPVSSFIDQIAAIAVNPGEFAFCVFIHGLYLEKSGFTIVL